MRTPLVLLSVLWMTTGCTKKDAKVEAFKPQVPTSKIEPDHHGLKEFQPGLLMGGQPTKQMLTELANAELKSVIDLKGPRESAGFSEAIETKKLGLMYHSVPIRSKADITWAQAIHLQRLLEETEKPVLVHCQSGNRVGALLALIAMVENGHNLSQAIEFGKQHGLTTLENHVRSLLEQGPPDSLDLPTTFPISPTGEFDDLYHPVKVQ